MMTNPIRWRGGTAVARVRIVRDARSEPSSVGDASAERFIRTGRCRSIVHGARVGREFTRATFRTCAVPSFSSRSCFPVARPTPRTRGSHRLHQQAMLRESSISRAGADKRSQTYRATLLTSSRRPIGSARYSPHRRKRSTEAKRWTSTRANALVMRGSWIRAPERSRSIGFANRDGNESAFGTATSSSAPNPSTHWSSISPGCGDHSIAQTRSPFGSRPRVQAR